MQCILLNISGFVAVLGLLTCILSQHCTTFSSKARGKNYEQPIFEAIFWVAPRETAARSNLVFQP